jgi:hypothetical protein
MACGSCRLSFVVLLCLRAYVFSLLYPVWKPQERTQLVELGSAADAQPISGVRGWALVRGHELLFRTQSRAGGWRASVLKEVGPWGDTGPAARDGVCCEKPF